MSQPPMSLPSHLPRQSCADCGQPLPSDHPRHQPCPSCRGMRRHYELRFGATLTVHGEMETLLTFIKRNPEWLVLQLFLVVAGAADGYTASIAFSTFVGVAWEFSSIWHRCMPPRPQRASRKGGGSASPCGSLVL